MDHRLLSLSRLGFPDIVRFTLYWTLVFYTPAFVLCGTYAFLNLMFTPHSRMRRYLLLTPSVKPGAFSTRSEVPLQRSKRTRLGPSPVTPAAHDASVSSKARTRHNERRSRLAFAILVGLVFALVAVAGAVIGAAIMGYVMAGLFKAARYNMST
jgi:hypothetical protein